MAKRAEDVAATRRRIVEATAELHGTVGPARTTIAAIAERAGVTRVTVYRHFPDEVALFSACSAHWFGQQQHLPDPLSWERLTDPEQRLRTALTDVYRFYREGAPMLARIRADWEAVPAAHREVILANDRARRDLVVAAFPRRTKRLRAAVGHALAFETWRSLCDQQGLPDREAVALMVELVRAARS